MMTCKELVELVTEFLDEELDSDTEERFRDHLAMCDGCERYLDQVKETIHTLGELPRETLPGEIRGALLAAFREDAAQEPTPRG
jgi:predicted anti-sigma-YlaC factor YlaD